MFDALRGSGGGLPEILPHPFDSPWLGATLLAALPLATHRWFSGNPRGDKSRTAPGSKDPSAWRDALLNGLPFPAFVTCADGGILAVNPALLQLTGHVAEHLIGRPSSSVAPAQDQILTASASLLPMRWSAASLPVIDGQSGVTLWLGFDLSELESASAARDAALRDLEELRNTLQDSEEIPEFDPAASSRIVGKSDAIRYVLHKIHQVAPTEATVLIEGETGVGKELVALGIHESSRRAGRPLIQVNCAALPANLIESELFGHEKGAFTGADRARPGRFELAQGGTLFLDEIGDLALDLQAKLLRALQEREYVRVGGTRTLQADVRVIAATNSDLEKAVEQGRFRKDLYYRLRVFPISVPALRDRPGDIPLLAAHFVRKLAQKHQRPVPSIPVSVVQELAGYPWPGNVRELEHVIERCLISSTGPMLALPKEVVQTMHGSPAASAASAIIPLHEMEKKYIEEVLRRVNGRIAGPGGAAELLALHPNTLRGRMTKLGVVRPN